MSTANNGVAASVIDRKIARLKKMRAALLEIQGIAQAGIEEADAEINVLVRLIERTEQSA